MKPLIKSERTNRLVKPLRNITSMEEKPKSENKSAKSRPPGSEAVKTTGNNFSNIRPKKPNLPQLPMTLFDAAKQGDLFQVKKCIEDLHKDVNEQSSLGETALHMASQEGHLDVIQYLVRKGANVNYRDRFGYHSLLWAVDRNNSLDVIKYLISTGASIEFAENVQGLTSLHLASFNGNVEVIQLLIDNGADIEARSHDGEIPIQLGAKKGNLRVVKFFIDINPAIMNVRDDKNQTLLHVSAANDRLSVVKYLVDNRGADINDRNSRGQMALDLAAINGNANMVRYFLEEKHLSCEEDVFKAAENGYVGLVKYFMELKGVTRDIKDKHGNTLLHKAATSGDIKLVQYLVREKRVNANAKNVNGWVALHVATWYGYLNIIEYLVRKGSDIKSTTNAGNTALHLAACKGHKDVVEFLLKVGVNLNYKDVNGRTALYLAAEGTTDSYDNLNVVEYLIEKRNMNFKVLDKFNSTLLHAAAKNGSLNVIKYLVEEKGCDVNAKDIMGYTPLIVSVKQEKLDVLRYLLESGKANYALKDSSGNTPLHHAVQVGNMNIVRILLAKGALAGDKNEAGFTPMQLANKNGFSGVVQYLLNEKIVNSDNMLIEAVVRGDLNLLKYCIEEEGKYFDFKDKYGWTLFHRAVENNHLNIVMYFLEDKKANINGKNGDGLTPLLIAASKGHQKMMSYLLEKGADVKLSDKRGNNALHYAVNFGSLATVVNLIAYGADVNAENSDGRNSLFLAAFGTESSPASLDIVKYLAEVKKGDYEKTDNLGMTILHAAVWNGSLDVVKYLLESKILDIDSMDFNGNTLISESIQRRKRDVFNYLLDKGADVRIPNYSASTPLHYAAQNEELEVLKILLEHGADLHALDINDRTALYSACNSSSLGGSLGIVKYFVEEKNLSANEHDKYGNTLLHAAVWNGRLDVLKYLIESKGVDVNVRDHGNTTEDNGNTPLLESIQRGHQHITTYLLERPKIDINVANELGTTSLHYAAQSQNLTLVMLLINKGANYNISNFDGETPLFWALNTANSSPSLPLIKYLIEDKKSDYLIRDKKGNTLLHAASTHGALHVVKYLVEDKNMDVNSKNKIDWTPIFHALNNNKSEVAKYFMRHPDTNVELYDDSGDTVLHLAAKHGQLNISKSLIEKGAAFERRNDYGETPLYWAVNGTDFNNNHHELFKFLIDVKKANVYSADDSQHNLLHAAAWSGATDVARYLIEKKGFNINARTKFENSPLILALQQKNFGFVEYLLDHPKLDVNYAPFANYTPLHYAAESNGFLKIVKKLIDRGCPLDPLNNDDETPLFLACRKYNVDSPTDLDIVKYLVDKKANVKIVSSVYNTLVHAASFNNDLAVLKYLVEEIKLDINERNKYGYNALLISSSEGYLKMVEYCLTVGADVNVFDNDLMTPLHFVARNGHLGVVKQLIKKGADVKFRDVYGATPIQWAAYGKDNARGHLSVVRYLIDSCNANFTINEIDGSTVLHNAAFHDTLDVVKYFVEYHNMDFNIKKNDGTTVLSTSIQQGSLSVTNYLLGLKTINVKAADDEGNTPLHYAAKKGYLDIAMRLVELGADVRALNKENQTPRNYTTENSVIDYLKKKENVRKRRHALGYSETSDINFKFDVTNSTGNDEYLSLDSEVTEQTVSLFEAATSVAYTAMRCMDLNGTMLLVDTLIRKLTNNSRVTASITRELKFPEIQLYSSKITKKFEKLINNIARKCGIDIERLDLDILEVYKSVETCILQNEYSKISDILYVAAKKAFVDHRDEKFMMNLKNDIEKICFNF